MWKLKFVGWSKFGSLINDNIYCRVQRQTWMWKKFSFQLVRISSKGFQNLIPRLRYADTSSAFHYSFVSMNWGYQFIHTSRTCLIYDHFISCINMFSLFVQPQTIRINQSDQAGAAGQGVQKSSCCGSWGELVIVFLIALGCTNLVGMKNCSLWTSLPFNCHWMASLVCQRLFYFIFGIYYHIQLNSLCLVIVLCYVCPL